MEICDGQHNPCIDPAINEKNETDNRKLAKRMRNHFVRLLLAWWKAAHYVFSPDTRLYYRRTLLQLISGDGKLFAWPTFINSVHIDAKNLNTRKDNPRLWFEYKAGYEFLEEKLNDKKLTVNVQSFSTIAAAAQTPSPKRRRQEEQAEANHNNTAPKAKNAGQPRRGQEQRNTPQPNMIGSSSGYNKGLARTLYATSAADLRPVDETVIEHFIDEQNGTVTGNTYREMLIQITNSGKRLDPSNPRAQPGSMGLDLN